MRIRYVGRGAWYIDASITCGPRSSQLCQCHFILVSISNESEASKIEKKKKEKSVFPRGNVIVMYATPTTLIARFGVIPHCPCPKAVTARMLRQILYVFTSSCCRAYFHAFDITRSFKCLPNVTFNISTETEAIFIRAHKRARRRNGSERPADRNNLSLKLYHNFNFHINFNANPGMNECARK